MRVSKLWKPYGMIHRYYVWRKKIDNGYRYEIMSHEAAPLDRFYNGYGSLRELLEMCDFNVEDFVKKRAR